MDNKNFEDIHLRLNLLELIIKTSTREVVERIGRGFENTRKGKPLDVHASSPNHFTIDYEEVKHVLENERESFKDTLESHLPKEFVSSLGRLNRAIHRLRLYLWLSGGILFLSLVSNVAFFALIKQDINKRTPTRMQIEMMKQGWEKTQLKEPMNVK